MKVFKRITEVLMEAVRLLEEKGVAEPRADAEILLSHVLNTDRLNLYIRGNELIDEKSYKDFMAYIARRLKGEPVQYIVGKSYFMGLPFKVVPGVLIPRHDTEILVERVLDEIKDVRDAVAVDVGCGSGVIAMSLARFKEDIFVYAVDIDERAVRLTLENADLNAVAHKIKVLKGDLFDPLRELIKERSLDAIVSNPPYISREEFDDLPVEVKDYEPFSALYGGEDGLLYYRRIIKEGYAFLKRDGIMAFEIGYNQADMVQYLMQEGFYDIKVFKDLAGLDRVVIGKKRKEA